MNITTIATWIMIAIIFWLAVYMIGNLFLGNGWLLVGILAGVSIGGMSFILWSEKPK